MAVTTEAITRAAAVAKAKPIYNSKILWLALLGLTVFNLWVRWYEQYYGWRAGLDAFSPEFKKYWMNWLYIEIVLEIVTFAWLTGYIYKTRPNDLDKITPREELLRYMNLIIWFVAYGYTLYWGGSFYTEQDGTWHQTVIRDTDFTPSHIIEFYMSYPIYSLVGIGAFFYARTRLPDFAKGWSFPFLLVTVGPFMIIPNVGLNEWGHTFWFMEELFVAPLHYGFVFFGWFAFAACGVFVQIFRRIAEICGPIVKGEA
jgi:methane/ammonia monooxygenase subunit C